MGTAGAPGFGALLRTLRHTAGLTIEELAGLAGLSPRGVSDLERGIRRSPHPRTVAALTRALDLAPEDARRVGDAVRAARAEARPVGFGRSRPPRPVLDFVGRRRELRRIHEVVTDEDASGVVVITGPPGIGKTSLAVAAALGVRDHYGAQVFVDLDGTRDEPTPPTEVARKLIAAICHGEDLVPEPLLIDRLHDLLRSRRALLVLDNVQSEAQVRPLLPSGPPSAAIVTGRYRLAGLMGVVHMALPELGREESVRLLRGIVEPDRGSDDELRHLADLCSDVPFALRIAANQVSAYPRRCVGDVIATLADAERRVDGLSSGDMTLRGTCSLSYDHLAPDERVVFRRLGLIADNTVSVGVAALLSGQPLDAAGRALDRLADLSLLDHAGGGRFALHDLLLLYARDRMANADDDAVIDETRDRADTVLLDGVRVAGRHLDSGWADPRAGAAAGSYFRIDSPRRAVGWLLDEWAEWEAAIRRSARLDRHEAVVGTLHGLHWFAKIWHHETSWDELFALGMRSAMALGLDTSTSLFSGEHLWFALADRADTGAAERSALTMDESASRSGDPFAMAYADYYGAKLLLAQGRVGEAMQRTLRAEETMLEQRHLDGAAFAIHQEAEIANLRDDSRQALARLSEAHRLLTAHRDEIRPLAGVLAMANNARLVAETNRRLGDWTATIAAAGEALDALDQFGLASHPLMTIVLTHRAHALEGLGRTEEALADREHARALGRRRLSHGGIRGRASVGDPLDASSRGRVGADVEVVGPRTPRAGTISG